MIQMFPLAATLVLFGGAATAATAQTSVPAGPLTELRWTVAGSPYELNGGDVVVPVGATLVVDAGVEISTSSSSTLRIEGRIDIAGRAGRPVRLNGLTQQTFGGLVLSPGSTGVLRHVYVRGGLEAIRSWARSLTITDSVFENNFSDVSIEEGEARIERTRFLGGSFVGVIVRPTASLALYNSIVRNKGSVGLYVETATSSLPSEIVNCTFYRNGLGGLNPDGAIRVFVAESNGPRITIKNSIIASSLVGVGVDRGEGVSGAVVDVSYSDISTNTTTYDGPVQQKEGIIFFDPEFRSSDDLRLQRTSPALDSGSPHAGVTTDIEGKSRPGGLGWDMGAYETSSACGNTVPEVDEECDDGNVSNRDTCLNSCVSAFCGDGFVHVGIEECDDGDRDDRDGCSSNCIASTAPRNASTSSSSGCGLTERNTRDEEPRIVLLLVAVLLVTRRRRYCAA